MSNLTVKQLQEAFPQLDQEMAVRITTTIGMRWNNRRELAHEIFGLDEEFPATYRWLRQCHHYPSIVSMKMHMINEVLDTHGIEGFALDGYFSNPHLDGAWFTYCNTGDTYDTTVGYCPIEKEFIITSWGDYYEEAEKEGHVIREEER